MGSISLGGVRIVWAVLSVRVLLVVHFYETRGPEKGLGV